jgi:hypothetical protein
MSGNLEKSGGPDDANGAADPAVAAAPVVEPESGLHGSAFPPVAVDGAAELGALGWAGEPADCAAAPADGAALPGEPGAAVAAAGGHGAALAAVWAFFLPNSDPRF